MIAATIGSTITASTRPASMIGARGHRAGEHAEPAGVVGDPLEEPAGGGDEHEHAPEAVDDRRHGGQQVDDRGDRPAQAPGRNTVVASATPTASGTAMTMAIALVTSVP